MLSGINQNFINNDAKPVTLTNVPVVYADKPGRNRNIYPEDELLKAIEWWKKVITLDPTHRYALIKHPKDESEESFDLLSGFIDDLRYDVNEKCLRADFKLLPTTWGLLISYLSSNGYPVGVSLRGNADPELTMMTINNKPMEVTIRRNLKLEGIDFVMYPSYITTQVTKDNVKESRSNNNITKVIENFKKEYDKQISLEDLKKLDTVFKNEKNIIDIKNVGGTKMEDSNIEKMQFEVDKLNVSKERLQMDIEKLENSKSLLENDSNMLQSQIDSLKNEITSLNDNLNNSTSEFTIISKKKIDFENDLKEKTDLLNSLTTDIEQKNSELKDLEEKISSALTQSIDSLVVKKGNTIFNNENKPKIRLVDPSERVSKTEWNNENNEEIQKLVFLSDDDNLKNSIFCVNSNNEWDGLNFPLYQLFKSENNEYDFDAVINKNALLSVYDIITSRAGYAIEPQEKRTIANKVYQNFKNLENLGIIKDIPENLIKICESKISVESGNYILDNIIDSLLFNSFIDIDNISHDESSESDTSTEVTESVIDLKEQSSAILAAIANALVNQINGDEENEIQTEIDSTVQENTISEENNENEQVKKIKLTIDGYENKVFEQFNPNDENINIQDEITKFSSMLLTTNDNAQTPFASTYELNNNEDLYAFFGVMRDSFIGGDFITSTQMMKGVIATAIASQMNTIAPIEDNNGGQDAQNVTDTTQNANIQSQTSDDTTTDDYESRQGTLQHINEQINTDASLNVNTDDASIDIFDKLNYAFNITSVILEKYAELKNFFIPSSDDTTQSTDTTSDNTTQTNMTQNMNDMSQTSENESREIENTESQVSESTNDIEGENATNDNENKVSESTETQNIENEENGGNDMEKLNAIIDLVNQNFESEDAITESNILDAIGSIIQDYMETSDKITTLSDELTESKSRLASFEFNNAKEEKTRTLEQAGVDKEVIDVAFKEITTVEDLEKESEKLLTLVSKVSESTKKVELSRKGRVSNDPIDVNTTEEKDHFDRLMGNI